MLYVKTTAKREVKLSITDFLHNDDGNKGRSIFNIANNNNNNNMYLTSRYLPPLPRLGCAMTRSFLTLVGPPTLLISLLVTGIAPNASRASLDVVGDPFLNLDSPSDDYIDAHGLPVDVNEYSWGGYAKKRNTAVRATLQPHPRGELFQLLSRQVAVHHPFTSCSLLIFLSQQSQCTAFQTTCLQGGGCCPNTKVCEYW